MNEERREAPHALRGRARVPCRRLRRFASVFAGAILLIAATAVSGDEPGRGVRLGPGRVPKAKTSAREALAATPGLKEREVALGVATAQWSAYPLYGGEMTSIAASPVNARIAWVGTRDAGVFKTTRRRSLLAAGARGPDLLSDSHPSRRSDEP